MYFNLWMVFLLSGLWHGAGWNFLIWGAYHGFWLVAERMGLKKVYDKIGKVPSVIITFILAVIGWVFFRLETFHDATTLISRMFAFDFKAIETVYDNQFYTTLIVALIFSFLCLFPFGKKIQNFVFYQDYSKTQHIIVWVIAIFLLLFCLGAFNSVGFSPFIYFRF